MLVTQNTGTNNVDSGSLDKNSNAIAAVGQGIDKYPGPSLDMLRSLEHLLRKNPAPTKVPQGMFVYAAAPARIDLSGGWTDVAFICRDHGGKVTNVAVNVNNAAPYKVKARRTEHLVLSCSYDDGSASMTIDSLDQLRDYADPTKPFALIKACIVATGILGVTAPVPLVLQRKASSPRLTSPDPDLISAGATVKDMSLQQYLEMTGGGLEITLFSSLPQGSGLGSSSILASALLAVLMTLMGVPCSIDEIGYTTLLVEMMMTTCGGWQDSYGGIVPGFKVLSSEAGPEIQVQTKRLPLSEEWVQEFNSRLLLIYTGKTRLAKNLMDTVLSKWSNRDKEIVDTMDRLVEDSGQCELALTQGDFQAVGEIISRYYKDKMFLSSTTLNDPPVVAAMLHHLDSMIDGATLCGAGAGGFLAILIKQGQDRGHVMKAAKEAVALYHASQPRICACCNDKGGHQPECDCQEDEGEDIMWSWEATVDNTHGLVVTVGEEP